jgi:hypothetical protein
MFSYQSHPEREERLLTMELKDFLEFREIWEIWEMEKRFERAVSWECLLCRLAPDSSSSSSMQLLPLTASSRPMDYAHHNQLQSSHGERQQPSHVSQPPTYAIHPLSTNKHHASVQERTFNPRESGELSMALVDFLENWEIWEIWEIRSPCQTIQRSDADAVVLMESARNLRLSNWEFLRTF